VVIGYSYWGFLGDYKEDEKGNTLSTPDGNASYSWSIIHEAQKRGHRVIKMQTDRDWWAFRKHGKYNFASFSQEKRFNAYLRCSSCVDQFYWLSHVTEFPPLDILLLEWRFPIPGRNCDVDIKSPLYQPDLDRQNELLNHYGDTNTKIVIFDLDHKLEYKDEAWIKPHAVFETSSRPLHLHTKRTRVEIPFVTEDLLQHPLKAVEANRKISYVGSRYERDDVIDRWIKPLSDKWPQQIEFWGNWTADYNFAEVKAKWPNINYRDRITMKDFDKAYNGVAGCPLIAKQSYLDQGFVTARLWETLLFGTIPIGFGNHVGIDEYLPQDLIITSSEELGNKIEWLSAMSLVEREELRRAIVEKISFMDVRNFLDKLEGV